METHNHNLFFFLQIQYKNPKKLAPLIKKI